MPGKHRKEHNTLPSRTDGSASHDNGQPKNIKDMDSPVRIYITQSGKYESGSNHH